jgi:hypothetical protein
MAHFVGLSPSAGACTPGLVNDPEGTPRPGSSQASGIRVAASRVWLHHSVDPDRARKR